MSAKDLIHQIVKTALQKDGWTITHDPFRIVYEGESVYADLAAERPIAAERAGQKIVVEVKSFVGYSVIQDFKEALGQYILYHTILVETEPEYRLYLAVSDVAYTYDLQRKMIQLALEQVHVPLIVVDIEAQEIVQWVH